MNKEMMHTKIKTLGDLKESGWSSESVKEEMRRNLIRKLHKGEDLFPGILGYDKTVIPQLVNSILAKHDIILLGLRGQAKTRILRMLVNFLDEFIPVVDGSEINDDPLDPLSRFAREKIRDMNDDTPLTWLHRDSRYGEKLATPDTTVADLIGDLDPIKAASERLSLANENVINFGLIPRTNRGIFVINELPDLQPRIQVALLNIMQERDIQIRGFNVRIPLDVAMAYSANPEDYTNRGSIITPLKDRIDAQILTHYPRNLEIGKTITSQEAWLKRNGKIKIYVPDVYREILEHIAFEARGSEYVDQKSGVSTRMTITALEQIISSAERRCMITGDEESGIRIADLYHVIPAITGKLELVYEGEQEGALNVAKHLIGKAVANVFKQYFPDPQEVLKDEEGPFEEIINWFASGNTLELPDTIEENEYKKRLMSVDGLEEMVKKHVKPDKMELTLWMDLVLEGLHQNSKLGKEDLDDTRVFSDMLGSMLGNMGDFEDDDIWN
ncbi:MAG: magnesium chelatase [Balneolaceae bacterium]